MIGNLVRYQQTGDFHFVTFSCYQRLPFLGPIPGRKLFERSLETMRVRYNFIVGGYVVMPEHVHILLSEPRNCALDKAIQALKLSVAVHHSKGRFWQSRYYDFNVYSSRKMVEKLRYMHRNPVERGLIAEPNDWAWSSFRHYSTGKIGTVEIESQWTAMHRDHGNAETHVSKSRHGAPAS